MADAGGISGFFLFLLEIIPDDPSDDISTASTFFSCDLVDLCKKFVVDSDRAMFFHLTSLRIFEWSIVGRCDCLRSGFLRKLGHLWDDGSR